MTLLFSSAIGEAWRLRRRSLRGSRWKSSVESPILPQNFPSSSFMLHFWVQAAKKFKWFLLVLVVQYTARFNADAVKNFLYSLNEGKIPKKRFNLRLAPEETSNKLTGFEHNGVTCIVMKTDLPVILDEAITKLRPDFFWLGGGEIDLKLGIRTSEFVDFVKPFIVPCS